MKIRNRTYVMMGVLLSGGLALSSFAQQFENVTEREPGEGFHQEEWYDPSDWFNEDDQISFEYESPYFASHYWDHPWLGADVDRTAQPRSAVVFIWMPSQQQWQQARQGQMTGQTGGQATLQGTVEGFREIEATGQEQGRTLVKITLEDGQSKIVDLGQRTELEDLNLEQGDEIKVTGRQGQAEGQPAIVAENIVVDGQQHQIQRQGHQAGQGQEWQSAMSSREQGQQTAAQQGQQGQQQQQLTQQQGQREQASRQGWSTVQGTIESFKQMELRSDGQTQKHTFATVRESGGESKVIYLGLSREFERMDLEKGDRIQATGKQGTVGNQQVFLADTVTSGNQQFSVQYEGGSSGPSQQMAQQQGRQQQPSRPMAQQQGQQQASQPMAQQQGQQQRFEGTVEGFRQIQVQGQDRQAQEHTLVRITLENGQTKVIDLGPRMRLQDLNLQQGDRIQVMGRQGQAEGQPSILAENVTVDGRQFDIQRQMGRQPTIAFQPGQQPQTTVTGRIKDFRNAQVGEQKQDHLVVRLEQEQGEEILVDFGPGTSLEEMGLQKNDRVRITGSRSQVEGKGILMAREVSVVGQEQKQGSSR